MDAAARDYVINTLCTLTLMVPFCYAITKMLTFRHPWAYILSYCFGAAGLRIALGLSGLDGVDDIVQTVLLIGVILAASNDKFYLRVFAAVAGLAAMQIVDAVGTAFLASLGTQITPDASSSLFVNIGAYVLARAVTLLLEIIILYLLVVIWNRLLKKSGSWTLLVFALFPLSQSLLIWFSTAMQAKAGAELKNYMLLVTFILISVAADVVMSGDAGAAHEHTLGLVLAAAYGIEAQLAVLSSREVLQSALEVSPDGIVLVGTDYRPIWGNTAAKQLFGMDTEELMRMDIREMIPDVRWSADEWMNGKKFYADDIRVMTPNGTVRCTAAISPAVNYGTKTINVTLKKQKHLIDSVNKMSGNHASYTFDDIITRDMLSISTGTNNVYPAMMEGTVAGMAAAAAAKLDDPYSVCIHDKRVEVYVNGQYRDMALIDAVISDDEYVGARAIWDPKRMRQPWPPTRKPSISPTKNKEESTCFRPHSFSSPPARIPRRTATP